MVLIEDTLRPSKPWYSALRRFWPLIREPGTLLGLTIVIIAVAAAAGAPLFAPHDPTELNLDSPLLPPSAQFPLGADHLGRDELSRMIYGARTTVGIAGAFEFFPRGQRPRPGRVRLVYGEPWPISSPLERWLGRIMGFAWFILAKKPDDAEHLAGLQVLSGQRGVPFDDDAPALYTG